MPDVSPEALDRARGGRAELVERVPVLEDGGWAMVFSHGATANHVRARAAEMASLAEQRAAAIERIVSRQSSDG